MSRSIPVRARDLYQTVTQQEHQQEQAPGIGCCDADGLELGPKPQQKRCNNFVIKYKPLIKTKPLSKNSNQVPSSSPCMAAGLLTLLILNLVHPSCRPSIVSGFKTSHHQHSPGQLPLRMNSHIYEQRAEDEQIGAIVNCILYQCCFNLPGDGEASGASV